VNGLRWRWYRQLGGGEGDVDGISPDSYRVGEVFSCAEYAGAVKVIICYVESRQGGVKRSLEVRISGCETVWRWIAWLEEIIWLDDRVGWWEVVDALAETAAE
jgi:hypothetical protein